MHNNMSEKETPRARILFNLQCVVDTDVRSAMWVILGNPKTFLYNVSWGIVHHNILLSNIQMCQHFLGYWTGELILKCIFNLFQEKV